MPKIQRRSLPPDLLEHLLERAATRQISFDSLVELYDWLNSNPIVPEARWFKRFRDMIFCGEGALPKTFLLPGQHPFGEEVT